MLSSFLARLSAVWDFLQKSIEWNPSIMPISLNAYCKTSEQRNESTWILESTVETNVQEISGAPV
jgi:hypothetical protein